MHARAGGPVRRVTLHWKVLVVPVLAGVFIVAGAFFAGPGLLGAPAQASDRVGRATVVQAVPCSNTGAREGVRVEFEGQRRDATLSACGHTEGEQFDVTVPENFTGGDTPEVRIATAVTEPSGLFRPVGFGLLALSCAAGGVYAYLVLRGPRRRAVLI
ncbi:hypothetical protein [Amycolatopsis suaedae]|uniref:Uncharacterized protein n=1 Tax=Amycolatopsis suaedae TaxID=2510978 RepID=A0A4Q7J6Y0_9PSEU|nr:hypothetical protein [Amycolatopsis suaedae]RZQ62616.1 hypothetical protein EWH70_16740 [Amycolatopsis suaedae]